MTQRFHRLTRLVLALSVGATGIATAMAGTVLPGPAGWCEFAH